MALTALPLPLLLAVPVDLRLLDLLPADELDLADDTLPSSLRLALRDCKEGKLLCLDSNDLRLLLLLVLAAAAGRLVELLAVAGRRWGLLALLFELAAATPLGHPSSSDSVSISSARSTSGAFFLRDSDDVCVPDDLVGEPTAIVPRLAMLLLLLADAVPDAAVPVTGRLPAAAGGDRDLARPVLVLVLALAPLALLPLVAGRTGDRDRVLGGAVGDRDLARIAAARALAAWVIRTGDLDLAALLLELALAVRVVVRAGDLDRPLLRAFVAAEAEAKFDLVVSRTGDLDLVRVRVAVLFSPVPMPLSTAPSAALLVKDLALDLALVLALVLDRLGGTTAGGRFGES